MSASANAVSGVFSLGLSTTRLLVATAGASLWITWFSGMIERRDGGDDAQQGLLQRVDLAALAMCREVAGEHLAVVDEGLVGGEQQHIRGAADLVLRILQAQARLERDQTRQLRRAAPR